MRYQITVRRTEENSNFAKELDDYEQRKRDRYAYQGQEILPPQREVVKDVLLCELSEDQFKKVKAEVLKVFE